MKFLTYIFHEHILYRMKLLNCYVGLIRIGNGVAGFTVINIVTLNGLVGLHQIALLTGTQE